MGFWIFMLIMDLLIPFTMIGFGKMFLKKATCGSWRAGSSSCFNCASMRATFSCQLYRSEEHTSELQSLV